MSLSSQKQFSPSDYHRVKHGIVSRYRFLWIIGTLALVGGPVLVLAQNFDDSIPARKESQMNTLPLESADATDRNLATSENDLQARATRGDTGLEIEVNGREISIPKSGSLHQTYRDVTGTTEIDIQTDNESASINIQSNSDSYSDSKSMKSED